MRFVSLLALAAIASCTPKDETEDAKVAPVARPIVDGTPTAPVATVDVLIATLREAVKTVPNAESAKAWRWSEGTGARAGEKILSCSVKGAEVLCQTVAYAPLGEPQDDADGGGGAGGDDHDDHDDHDHDGDDGDDDDLPPIDPDGDGDGGGGDGDGGDGNDDDDLPPIPDPDGDGGTPPNPPNPRPTPPSPRPNPPPGPGPKPVPCRWV